MNQFLVTWKSVSYRWHSRHPQRLIVAMISLFIGSILGNIIIDLNARTASSFNSAMSATMNQYGTEIRFQSPISPKRLEGLFDRQEWEHLTFFPFEESYFTYNNKRFPLTITFCLLENCTGTVQVPKSWNAFIESDARILIKNKNFPIEFHSSPLATAQIDLSAFPIQDTALSGLFITSAVDESALVSLKQYFPNSEIYSQEDQKSDSDTITSAFRQNLFALAMVALLVAGYLVYASLDISFENRSQLFASLMSLGANKKLIGYAILTEAVLLGFITGTLAWILGGLLASKGWQFFSLILPDVFGIIPTQYDSFLPGLIIVPIATITSVLAAYLAYKRRETITARKRESLMHNPSQFGKLALSVIAIFISTYLLFYEKDPRYGYISVFALFYLIGQISSIAIHSVTYIFPSSIQWKIAGRALQGYNMRFTSPVSALAVAISLCIAMTVLISSFKFTLNEWLITNVKAESYFSFKDFLTDSERESFLKKANQLFPNQIVQLKLGTSMVMIEGKAEKADLMVQSFGEIRNTNPPAITMGELKGVLASETAMMRWNLRLDDEIFFPELDQRLKIGGFFKNYTSRRGTFLIDRDEYGDNPFIGNLKTVGAAFYLSEASVKDQLNSFLIEESESGNHQPSAELRESALSLFDKTFSITYILQIITFLLASSAIAFSLISLISARKRQFAIIATYTREPKLPMIQLLVYEAIGVLLASLFIAIPSSLFLTWILIEGINRFSFGWTLSWDIPYLSIFMIVMGSLLSGLVTTIYLGKKLPVRNIWELLKSRE